MAASRVGANVLWKIVEEVRDPYGIDPHQPGPVTGFAGIFATDASLEVDMSRLDCQRKDSVVESAAEIVGRNRGPERPITDVLHLHTDEVPARFNVVRCSSALAVFNSECRKLCMARSFGPSIKRRPPNERIGDWRIRKVNISARIEWGSRMDEDYNAGDKCGRCGCARRDHAPACANHPKCKGFSAPRAHKAKKA
jgi:hypothetical protein